MDIDRSLAPAEPYSAELKRSWISPAVDDLGGMRTLTLLQGGSIPGGCEPDAPSCG